MTNPVLSDLVSGRASLSDIERAYEQVMAAAATNVRELLGMSQAEWTAFGHGVWFDELARWRISGWPESCPACGGAVTPGGGGWLAQETSEGEHRLVHIDCLPKARG